MSDLPADTTEEQADSWICKHGRIVSSAADCLLHPKRKPYHTFRPWIRWLPFPLLIWIAKRFGSPHVWYQDEDFQVEWRGR